jgi:hypothetical protein
VGHSESALFLDLGGNGDELSLLRQQAHRVALDVLRPAAWALDRMTPAERIAPGSPFFTAMAQLKSQG